MVIEDFVLCNLAVVIALTHLYFQYLPRRCAFRSFHCSLSPGQTLGFHSFLVFMCRFVVSSSGEILVKLQHGEGEGGTLIGLWRKVAVTTVSRDSECMLSSNALRSPKA